jgi:hypothetical protein
MGGRAVEGTGLENRQARKGLVGSNPTPSAIKWHLHFDLKEKSPRFLFRLHFSPHRKLPLISLVL